MIRDLICVSCPLGCPIKVELSDGGEVVSVTGNTCARGKQYAISECTAPVRVLTTTVKVIGGQLPVAPVKTNAPIPKDKMFDCMKSVNAASITAPAKIGDVVIADVCGTGADIVVTNIVL